MAKTEKSIEIKPIIYPSVELKALLNKAIQENGINMQVTPFPLLPADIGQNDLALAVILDLKPSHKKAAIKAAFQKMEETINITIQAQIDALGDNIAAIFFQTIFKIVFELIDQIITPFDKDIVNIQITWNKLVRLFRKLCDPNLGEEIKEALRQKMIEELTRLINTVPFVADIIALIMLFDTMKATLKTLRDAKRASAEDYMTTEERIKNTQLILNQEVFLSSQIITTIVYFLGMLLPLISALCAVFCTARKYESDYADACTDAVNDLNANAPQLKDKHISIIKELASRNLDGFSYSSWGSSTQTSIRKASSIPIGTTYRKIDDIWTAVGLPDILSVEYDNGTELFVCKDGDGTIIAFTDKLNNDTLTTIDPFPDYCHTDIDFTDICPHDDGYHDNDDNKYSDDDPSSEDMYAPYPNDYNPALGGDSEGNRNSDNEQRQKQKEGPKGAFIEYCNEESISLNYTNGASLNEGDKIGKINGIDIVSPCSGINAKTDGHITFMDYAEKTPEEILSEIEKLQAGINTSIQTDERIQKIVDKFEKLSKAKIIIKDYLCKLRLPYIPSNLTTSGKPKVSKDYIVSDYFNECDKIVEKYEDDIQVVTGREHVESRLNDGKMDELKNDIMTVNNEFYNTMLTMYDNYLRTQNYRCDTKPVDSYSLLTDYLELYDEIYSDDDNEYVVELEQMIRSFIKDRSALETLTHNDCVAALNELCDTVIKSRWVFKDVSYIDKFDEIYTLSGTVGYGGDNNIKQKPLYDFLVNLMDCGEQTQQTIEVTSLEDIQNMDQSNSFDVSKAKTRKEIKKICRRYFVAKEVTTKIIDDTLSENDRKARLREQCAKEVGIIEIYANKIKDAYFGSADALDDNVFNELKTASVQKYQNVFYNGIEYEHYFVTDGTGDDDIAYDDDYNNALCDVESAPNTKHPPYNMKYWLLYCLQATLVHCMLPMYWPCGLLIAGAPVPLPVIYIPIYCLKGEVQILFGLGVCGMFIWPMILFVNFGIDGRTIIAPLNMVIQMIQNLAGKLVIYGENTVKDMAYRQYMKKKNAGESFAQEIEKIDIEIADAKELLIGLGRARKERQKRRKELRESKKTRVYSTLVFTFIQYPN